MSAFSNRTDWQTQPNRLSQALNKLLKKGERVFDLTESNPTRCSFHYLNSKVLEPLANPKNLSYEPDPRGLGEAREAVSKYYAQKKVEVHPNQIFLVASTSEAYSWLFRLLTNPGDKILVPNIGYPLFEFLAGLNDVEVGHYGLNYDVAWRVDVSSLSPSPQPSPARGEGVRALILVNPNNPTGNFIHKHERKEINAFCKGTTAALISDEVFFDYAYEENPDRAPSFAANEEVLTFTLSGVSKVLGLPQMKLSWIVVSGPKKLREEAITRLEVISDTYLSANTPSQRALPAWLEFQPQTEEEILDRVLSNREILKLSLQNQSAVKLLHGEGGWYAILEIASSHSDEELALELLEHEKVYVHPGYFFDLEHGTHLIVSLLPPADIFQESLRRILKVLS
jgi:aspartate/methionine/tyrosine aminotransferase